MSGRRLSLSACEATRFELAQHLIPHYNCLSLLGPPTTIEFSKSGVFWSSLYYLLRRDDKNRIQRRQLVDALKETSKLFHIELNYFSLLSKTTVDYDTHLWERNIKDGSVIRERKRKTRYQNLVLSRKRRKLLGDAKI